jgi:HSP20 family protein
VNEKIFRNLRGIQHEMMKILGEVSSLTHHPMHQGIMDEIWHPRCDVFETDTEFCVILELAGVEKSAITITTTEEYIRIAGKRSIFSPNRNLCYHNMEIETGEFDKKIYYPASPIDKSQPKVTYENGMLSLMYPLHQMQEQIIHIE